MTSEPSSSVDASVPLESSRLLFSILIPVYNEQGYLARVVENVLAAPLPDGLDREIVLVDDCSTDRTPEVIRELVEKYPEKIRAFRQPRNRGKGAAIRRAIQEMKGDYAIIQDADLEYNPQEYPLILAPLLDGRADVVYGSRFASRETRKILQYHHKLGNLFLTRLSNFMTGLDLTDMETCYKAFRGDALKSIPLRSNRFGIEPEITAKIARRGWTVYEVPISYNGRRYSEGKKIGWKDGVSAICVILKYWFYDDSFYDADSESSQRFEYSRNFLKTFVKRATPYLGSKTMEVEAGLGTLSRYLPQKERLTLTESDDRKLKFLRGSYDGNSVVDVEKLDLFEGETSLKESDKESFDSILCLNRGTELPLNNPDALAELRQYLKPDGRLIFTALADARPCRLCRRQRVIETSLTFKPQELVQLAEDAGYVVEKIEPFASVQCFFRKRNPNKAPSLLCFKLFDLLVSRTSCLDKILQPVRYLVVATPRGKDSKTNKNER